MKKHIVTQQGIAAGLLTAPTAHITTNKSRKKIYNNNQVYLKDKEDFQFELFNPTTSSVLAKIKLNGKDISSSGIVIKPGQRVFLDRFLDSPNKFTFETYEVNGNNTDVQKAIDLNGSVEVSFYNEKVYFPTYNPYTYTTTNYYDNYNPIVGTCYTSSLQNQQSNNLRSLSSMVSNNSTTTTGTYNVTSLLGGSSQVTLDCLDNAQATKTKTTVTGTIEKGEKSNQEFEYVNKDFNYYDNYVVKYKILPFENKPVEVKEIKKTKNFCQNCGSKEIGNFCSSCGNKI